MQKRRRARCGCLAVAVLCALILCGCHDSSLTSNPVEQKEETAMAEISQETLQSDYEVEMENREGFVGEKAYEERFVRPQMNSNIYVDLIGYTPNDDKIAYFVGNQLSEAFYVIDTATKECVFTGQLKQMGNQKKDGKAIYRGNFSSVSKPGVYYIQTPVIGQSYTFRISDDRYKIQFEELMKEFMTSEPAKYYGAYGTTEERMELLYSFQKIAMAYYFFPDAYPQGYYSSIEEHVTWLLGLREEVLAERSRQNKEQGRKVSYANPQEWEKQAVCEDYIFATVMSVSYMVLKPRNETLASQCLLKAQQTYQAASKYNYTGDLQYMAAASLFANVGNYTYNVVISEANQEPREVKQGEILLTCDVPKTLDAKLWGNLFYMMSAKGADIDICEKQMALMMEMCAGYLNEWPKNAFGKISDKTDNAESCIWLTIADYIIVSREYRNVCKQQIHTLFHSMEEIDYSHHQKSTLLLILANIKESEETE